MIVGVHVATGGVAGAALRSRRAAVAAGVVLHLVGDAIPHRDFRSRRFELASGAVGVLALALRRGVTDSATIGALASAAPDFEHVVRLPRPGGRRLFPSHRWGPLHRSGGISAPAQLAVAAALLAILLVPRA